MRVQHCLRTLLFLLAAAWAGHAAAGYQAIGKVDKADPMAVHRYRLDNGLEVNLTVNRDEPRFYAEIAVRAGSKMDPAESTGLAHYLEHMLFKGTQQIGTLDYAKEKPHIDRIVDLYEQHFAEQDPAKRAELYKQINDEAIAASAFEVPNELDRLYAEMGGSLLNAHTWNEETVYKVGLPANRLEQWAAIESERFSAPVYRLFVTELEAVYEELNRLLDNKSFMIERAVELKLYKNHPYGQQPTIGIAEHLKNPSLKNIAAFYDTWYVPNNMSIFISGDIDPEKTIKIIDANFSAWKPKELPAAKTWKEEPLNGREETVVQYEGEEYLLLAFRTVARNTEDADAVELMDMVLDNATAGLINLNLNQRQLVRQAGAHREMYNDYGSEYLWGIPKKGQTLEEVEKLLLEQLDKVKRGEIEDWLIPAIIQDYKKNQKAGLENNVARVSLMRDTWIAHEDWERAVRKIERMEKLTKADVVRVANKYFGKDYVAGLRKDAPHQVPNFPKPKLAKVDIDPSRESAFGAKIRAMKVEPIEPVYVDAKDYEVRDDSRGRKLYYAHNPINDIFNFSIAVDFGSFEDNTIQTATQFLDKSGTERFSPEDLQKEWYKLGASFGISAGDNETTIALTGLDENFEDAIALMMEVLRTPKADEAVLEELKKIILVQRADARKQAPAIAAALVDYNRYGKESHFLRQLPTDAINKLTREQLYGAIRKLLDYKHVVSYTGSLPMKKVAKVLKRHFKIEEPLRDPPAYRVLKARRPEQTEVYFADKEGATVNVRIEYPTVTYDEKNRPALDLYNEYFAGGMAGIVFQELREARALAYAAGARYSNGYKPQDEDMMSGGIQSQNDKAPEAVTVFVDLIDKMPVSEERFALAKEGLINDYRTGKIGFRALLGTVRMWERYGLAPDPRKRRFEELQKADIQTMLEFHKRVVANHPKLISIVGDPKKIDSATVEKQGKIRKVGVDEIFVP